VTDVHLPRELQKRLEDTTGFVTLISEEAKTHNFKLMQLKNEHSQKMAAIAQNTAIERQVGFELDQKYSEINRIFSPHPPLSCTIDFGLSNLDPTLIYLIHWRPLAYAIIALSRYRPSFVVQ